MSREAKRAIAILALMVAVGVIVSAVRGDSEDRASPGLERLPATSGTVEVLYEVEGSVPFASVTLVTPTGIEQIEPDVPLVTRAGATGLTYRFGRGEFVSLSAQKTANRGGGRITCRITVDGRVVSENTSTADFGIASCDGSAT